MVPSDPQAPCDNGPLNEDVLFGELVAILKNQGRPPEDLTQVTEAFAYARQHHEGQLRKNGENYITHPVSVATILAGIPVDTPTITAAILHDTLEDTQATEAEIQAKFGDEVLKMVESVTKLGKFEFSSKEDQQAENFRKMFLAMAEDVRVIILKLADRLHNMRTLCHMKPEKQQKTAAETLEIFAPLANRLGMGKIRAELEDLSLQYLDQEKFNQIDTEISQTQADWDKTISVVMDKIQSSLKENGINAKIYSRFKNYYSIYRKMQTRQKSVHDIYDLSAVRIIVTSEKECYEVLGLIHNAFKPIPGRFKDYIAMPKSNLYQSLHTSVIGPYGRPLEVQIRTQEMHRIAEYGIAAHWKYKEAVGTETQSQQVSSQQISNDEQKLTWLRQMVEMKEDTEDAKEYVDSVKLDLFRDEVFVFTPKGKVVVLPRESTPVDFAYRIHTEVGNTCVGAMVNGKIVQLNYILKNGDFIEILTNKKSSPRLDWINFVQTQQAKSRIRQYYKKHFKEEHEVQGRRMLEEALTRAVFDEVLKSGKLNDVVRSLNYTTLDDLFIAVGYGEINVQRVTNKLKQPGEKLPQTEIPLRRASSAVLPGKEEIQGLEGMLYQVAKCCSPLPGEPIAGVVTRSRGVMVHRDDCPNLEQANQERMMAVSWGGSAIASPIKTNAVKLEVHAFDRVGVLKDILSKVADLKTNLSNAKVRINPDQTAIVEITVDVQNLQHLERIKQAILEVKDVVSVKRQQNGPLKPNR